MERKRIPYEEPQVTSKKKDPLMDPGEQDSTVADKGKSCHVVYSFVNMRELPSQTSAVLSVIANASKVILISTRKYGEFRDYYRVKDVKSGLEGYVREECIALDKEEVTRNG